jgi:hypothetical protein
MNEELGGMLFSRDLRDAYVTRIQLANSACDTLKCIDLDS